MSRESSPLLDVFLALRLRSFPLGIPEYLLALEALANGFGTGSREELTFMCRTVWAKSEEEGADLNDLLDAFLPKKLTEAELESFSIGTERTKELTGQRGHVTQPETQSREDRSKGVTSSAGWGRKRPTRKVESTVVKNWELNPNLDFIGDFPLTKRQMRRSWRYFRRMQRSGTPIEIDALATIEQVYRLGIFHGPVLIPRRINFAKLFILKDEGGSMMPFERVVKPLLDSARHSGLAMVTIAFFHDIPGDVIFRDSCLNDAIRLKEAIMPYVGGSVLLLSDGGAARGNYDQHRVDLTSKMLIDMRRFSHNIAWLNPTPSERWLGTSADGIRRASNVPMFTLDRPGLDGAVDVLRGR